MSETKEMLFEGASAMLAPTWHNLGMNDVDIEIPAGLALAPCVEVGEPWAARAAADEFENALAGAQEEWERTHPAPTPEEVAELEEFLAAEADATYGGTAQSAYQANAAAIEEARSLSLAFETGVGEEVAAYLRFAAGDRVVVETDPGQHVDAQVRVKAVEGTMSVAAIDVVAARNSTVDLSVVVELPDGEPGDLAASAADAKAAFSEAGSAEAAFSEAASVEATFSEAAVAGAIGTTLRVFADTDAHVNITRTQALDGRFIDVDDAGVFAAQHAVVQVNQTVLGAAKAYTGLAADLRGDTSRLGISTHYLGHGSQELDFNYFVRHHGERTECDLQANGVLAGASRKTLRGTIDLIRGAKGAQGSENETVLLVDEGVKNKTVPVILCNEDDVAGNHGATIGHIRDEQMFYLASRGLSREAAENMFVSAIVEQAAIDAPDEASRNAVVRLGESIAPGFADLFVD